MFSLFYKVRKGNKGQLATILLVILIAFIIVAFLAVNLGKVSLHRTRITNAAQAAVLAAGSVGSVLLNHIANMNDQMVLNFTGFTVMIQLALLSWIIDLTLLIIKIVKALTDETEWGQKIGFGLANLLVTSAMATLQISGASRVGGYIEKEIRELNDKIPKRTRDSGRLFGFMNAGVDEPKISFANFAGSWEDYLNLETGFERFMRLLPNTNKADTNYGTSTLSFSWDDKRSSHVVNNTVDLTITPLSSLNLERVTFGEIASDSSLRSELKKLIDSKDLDPWFKGLVKFGINMSPLILVLLGLMKVLIIVIVVVLVLVAAVAAVLAVLALLAFQYTKAARLFAVALACTVGAVAAYLIQRELNKHKPQNIPCLVKEEGANDLTVDVTIARTTNPSAIDYGIWQMKYPSFSYSARGTIVEGSIFPPDPIYDVEPH